jgi:hypothetical protein
MGNFGPEFDLAIVEQIDAEMRSIEVTRERRLTLYILTQDADGMSRISEENPKTYREMICFVEQFRDRTKGLLQAAENACARLHIANVGSAARSKAHRSKRAQPHKRG